MKLNYILIPLATLAVALAGSWFTSAGIESGWYDSIQKPVWTPSGKVIGAVWTTLFILGTISALIVWNTSPRNARFTWIIGAFIVNGILNVLWCYVFFYAHAPGAAIWEAIFLGLSVDVLVVLIWPVSIGAALLLVPYGAWVLFATFLTYSIWILNK